MASDFIASKHVIPSTATTAISKPDPYAGPVTHPLDPLTPDEIAAVSLAVKAYAVEKAQIKALKFITSNIIPPPKKVVLAVLGIPYKTGEAPAPVPVWTRKAETDLIDLVTGDAYNVAVSLIDGKWTVDTLTKLPEGTQPQISPEELIAAEESVRRDEKVRKICADIGLTPDQIRCDGWSIGYDDRFPKHFRVQQALMFARFGEHENLYAHPLDFVPVLDSNSMEVIHIDFPPHRDASGKLSVNTTAPPDLSADSLAFSNRERIPPPKESFDFLPDLLAKEGSTFKTREDIKPLHVVQPQGVSFKVDGHVLEWQKWKMHIAFSHREGIAISTVTYNDDGVLRPLFYRLSLAEMVVPYAAPEFPHPRKFAFDAGEYGMGTMANDLTLGCDCLGTIHYMPGSFVGHDGKAVIIKQAICIHEEDAGLLWKHTDYRPTGRSHAVRSRRLVVSMCCTLANYEYIWNYFFYQDGTVEFEIRLTGILQVYLKTPTEPIPYGTEVAPGINAHFHQHIFSLRVDSMVDGLQNTVIENDVVPLVNAPFHSVENYAGNAFIVENKVLKDPQEGARDYSIERERKWFITNPNVKPHYSTGAPPSYVIQMKGAYSPFLASEGSWVWTRAPFARNAVWVVKDVEGPDGSRVWPSGKYVPQTREEPEDSVSTWIKKDKGSIENEDVIVYVTLGTTHIPRPEDWPVMPVEHLRMTLKPVSFFKQNPGLDVPGASDKLSRSAFDSHTNGSAATNGSACCAH